MPFENVADTRVGGDPHSFSYQETTANEVPGDSAAATSGTAAKLRRAARTGEKLPGRSCRGHGACCALPSASRRGNGKAPGSTRRPAPIRLGGEARGAHLWRIHAALVPPACS